MSDDPNLQTAGYSLIEVPPREKADERRRLQGRQVSVLRYVRHGLAGLHQNVRYVTPGTGSAYCVEQMPTELGGCERLTASPLNGSVNHRFDPAPAAEAARGCALHPSGRLQRNQRRHGALRPRARDVVDEDVVAPPMEHSEACFLRRCLMCRRSSESTRARRWSRRAEGARLSF